MQCPSTDSNTAVEAQASKASIRADQKTGSEAHLIVSALSGNVCDHLHTAQRMDVMYALQLQSEPASGLVGMRPHLPDCALNCMGPSYDCNLQLKLDVCLYAA